MDHFHVGQAVRINGGRDYGLTGRIVREVRAIGGWLVALDCGRTVEVPAVWLLDALSNNGD